ncbi:PQQ-binding-like beta-propeller repeat protein [Streptomonospora sp. PA3]|uniref:outer membrane protein assembly factor BamB family protein n=1 Tax=Streptomonospora sp. PA3 TaxID=2607326 RepID=UPI0012DCEAFD|nr:PQQ-binding-like beta-propeller repeat protein [Streptomonospora sp. PA3]MUL44099.1 PQQ-binding-like beta-propeller repeat protein [Streptomonospora sp. PA3]
MGGIRRRFVLAGCLAGPVLVAVDLVFAAGAVPGTRVPVYVACGALTASALLAAHGHLARRAPDPDGGTWTFLAWAAAAAAALTAALAAAHSYGYTEFAAGDRYLLLAGTLAAVAAAAVQFAAAVAAMPRLYGFDTPGPPARAAGLAVVVLLFTVIGARTEEAAHRLLPALQHTTAGGDPAAAGSPGGFGPHLRQLDLPAEADSVQPIAAGFLVLLPDGVVAVDPRSGEERWRYRLLGSFASARVSPDFGKVVVLFFRSPQVGPSPRTTRATLDAATGELLHASAGHGHLYGHGLAAAGADRPVAGEDVTVETDDERGGFLVRGTSSGAPLWEFDGSADCVLDTSLNMDAVSDLVVTDRRVYAATDCVGGGERAREADTVIVHAFAAATGELLWTHAAEGGYDQAGLLSGSTDGSRLYRYEPESGRFFVLDAATGEELHKGSWSKEAPEWNSDRVTVQDPAAWATLTSGAYSRAAWTAVPGGGLLLGRETGFTLTRPDGEPVRTVELPRPDEGAHRQAAATASALLVLDWTADPSAPVALTSYPWDGSAPSTVDDVLAGRGVPAGASVNLLPTQGAAAVHVTAEDPIAATVT